MPLSESPETPYTCRTPASATTSTNKSATFFFAISRPHRGSQARTKLFPNVTRGFSMTVVFEQYGLKLPSLADPECDLHSNGQAGVEIKNVSTRLSTLPAST